ncbi:MAG: thymidine phosphorylase [Verrucomicrobia bacterium]|nr:thymidine phosphorylase [Verrucomicrobiota bacterium]
MQIQDFISCKRDGGELEPEAIHWFVREMTQGRITEGQVCAWLMAVYLRGMSARETVALTDAMMHSGEVADFSHLPGSKVDKHSTGGVGDKVSLILAPLAAACGLVVPMISGRGLGHTGGTLDKLEAIPGMKVRMEMAEFERQLSAIGVAMIGQSETMVPADRKLYALRDVTSTVESIPLICASIMSKKLAEGIDALVLDIKCGRGAFMKDLKAARALALGLVTVGNQLGKPTRALITRMDDPLGSTIGNAVEVWEAIEILSGTITSGDLLEVTLDLCVEMLLAGGICDRSEDAKALCRSALANGTALDKFRVLIQAQGGDAGVVDNRTQLPQAPIVQTVTWDGPNGYIHSVDSLSLARLTMQWGAGRRTQNDVIDPAVGLSAIAKRGTFLSQGDPVMVAHCRTQDQVVALQEGLKNWLAVAPDEPEQLPMLIERISS